MLTLVTFNICKLNPHATKHEKDYKPVFFDESYYLNTAQQKHTKKKKNTTLDTTASVSSFISYPPTSAQIPVIETFSVRTAAFSVSH